MARDLQGKNVVITGGASGIGLAIAKEFLHNGARLVILLDINEDLGSKATQNLNTKYGENKSVFIKCDVSMEVEKTTNSIISTYKTIDVLVNNAGIVEETNPKKVVEVNVTAVIEWSLKFVEHMRTDRGGKGGTIINISSIYGYRVDQYLAVYKASKYAVMGFTKTKGHQYNFNKTGVRLLVLCPGATSTNLGGTHVKYLEAKENQDDFELAISSMNSQEPEDVGKAAVVMFRKAESGTAWLIEGGNPISEV
ncbi:15-hydroxyprostaglandin dehydrogenase [NAD(+)]-like [Choristoneura fumiferana]|uniref:15-hydroxyprostaglandin dehydrogenase [NAD(+)]-like n=1 Tax=Choristoneura fumiferana TaxID=7141 RepID=UPI003D1591AC